MSHIGEVLLSISGAYHIHLLCKMHFESCAISHDYQSKRYEKSSVRRQKGLSGTFSQNHFLIPYDTTYISAHIDINLRYFC